MPASASSGALVSRIFLCGAALAWQDTIHDTDWQIAITDKPALGSHSILFIQWGREKDLTCLVWIINDLWAIDQRTLKLKEWKLVGCMSQQGGINTGTQCLVLYSGKKRLMLVVAILMAQNWTVQAIQ